MASAPTSGHDTTAALPTPSSKGAGSTPSCFHPEADINRALGEAFKQLNRPGQPSKDGGGSAARFVVANSVWTKRGTQLRKEYVQAMQSTLNVSYLLAGAHCAKTH